MIIEKVKKKKRLETKGNKYHSGNGKAKAREYYDFNKMRLQELARNKNIYYEKKQKRK